MTSTPFQLLHSRLRAKESLRASRAAVVDTQVVSATTAAVATNDVVTVGVWDLGAWLGRLPNLIEQMNTCQNAIQFNQVYATLPAGIVSHKAAMLPWIKRETGKWPDKATSEQIKANVIAEDFFERAELVRRDLKLDYLVGVTPRMVAFSDKKGVYWNYFSTFHKRLVLASCADLRVFAKKAKVAFESLLGVIIVAQVLVAMRYPKLYYHDDRGCLFDFNESRVSLGETVKSVHIEGACLAAIKPEFREPAIALVECVKNLHV